MDATTEEIRLRADIVEIVGQHVALREAGNGRYKACCPFHDEKTPSFYVSRDKGFYKCFGCGKSGDVFKFLIETENITFPEAKRMLADRYGIALPKFRSNQNLQSDNGDGNAQPEYSERDQMARVMAAASAFFREQFEGNAGNEARDYARSRGLSKTTLEKFGIGYSPDSWDGLHNHLINRYGFRPDEGASAGVLVTKESDGATNNRTRFYDRFRHRLMFPIWDASGRTIAFGGRALEGGQTGNADAKYINSPEGLLFKKSQVLYAYHLARAEVGKRNSIIISEGYMDAIALHEAGFSNTVATLGTALTTQHVALLRRLSPRVVYLCFDGDSAGMRAALRAAPLFAANNLDVRVVSLPVEDDPDTFIRKHGEVGFENALREAKLLMQYRVEMSIQEFDLSDLAQRKEGVRVASEVIAETPSDTEKDSYIMWLAARWAQAEGIVSPQRLEMVEAAIRREVLGAQKRWSKQDQARPQQNNSGRPTQAEENQNVAETLTENAGTNANDAPSGVVKAERALLSTLLSSPSWRAHILENLPPQNWTQPAHREIAALLLSTPQATSQSDNSSQGDDGENQETLNPVELIEKLPPESGGLIAELLLSDDAQIAASAAVVDDWIARIQNHWDKKHEGEVLELVKGKLERGEEISTEERAAYLEALVKTKRKAEN